MSEVTSFKFTTKTDSGSIIIGGVGGGSTPSNLAYTNIDNSFTVAQTFNADITIGANLFWTGTATGNGSGVTDLNATQLTTGTINAARLPSNVAFDNSDNNFSADQTFQANVTITGNLTVNGTQFITNTETVEIKDNLLIINNGETGSGVTAGAGGIEVDRGSLASYQFLFDESTDLFKIGTVGSLQAVATRPNSPVDGYYGRWNAAQSIIDFVSESNIAAGNSTLFNGNAITRFMLLDNSPVPAFSDGDVPVYQSADGFFSSLTLATVATTNSYNDLDDKPTSFYSFNVAGQSGSGTIQNTETLTFSGMGTVSTSYDAISNTLTILGSTGATPSLDAVTTVGSTTGNTITVAGLTIDNGASNSLLTIESNDRYSQIEFTNANIQKASTYWDNTNSVLVSAVGGVEVFKLTGDTGVLAGDLTATQDVLWSGSNSGNARATKIGYSGGNYGGIGYGINYTGVSGQHTYAFADIATRVDLYGGLNVWSSNTVGGIGATVGWIETFVARLANGVETFQWRGQNIAHAGNFSNFLSTQGNIAKTDNANNFTVSQVMQAGFESQGTSTVSGNLTVINSDIILDGSTGSSKIHNYDNYTGGNVGTQWINTGGSTVVSVDASNGRVTATSFSGDGSLITGVNANTLDGIDSSQFLRSDQSDTMSGDLTVIGSLNVSAASGIPNIQISGWDVIDWGDANHLRFGGITSGQWQDVEIWAAGFPKWKFTSSTLESVGNRNFIIDGYVESTSYLESRRGMNGGYDTSSGTGTTWGGTIYSIGASFDGTDSGTTWNPTSLYGLAWVRGGNTNENSDIGEGIYVYQNSNLEGGVGTAGIYSAGKLTVDGLVTFKGFTNTVTEMVVADSNGNLSTQTIPNGGGGGGGQHGQGITSVTVGAGLDVANATTIPDITLDLSELIDMTATMVGTDEFIVLDAGAERRKAASEIGLSIFSNDSGFITSNQTITLTGDVTGSGTTSITTTITSASIDAAMLSNGVISGRTALTSGLASNDELFVSDAGVLKRMDVSVLQTYMQSNLSFTNNSGTVTLVTGGTNLNGTVTSTGSLNLDTTLTGMVAATFSGNVTAGTISGNGSGLTSLNASNISSGTLSEGRLGNETIPARATELSSSVSLDSLQTHGHSGFYYQASNADTAGNNYPNGQAGSLMIQKSSISGAIGVTQLYQTYEPNNPELFFRSGYGSFSDWKKVIHTGNYSTYISKTYIDGLGISATTLDGIDSGQFLRSDQSDTMNGTLTTTGAIVNGSYVESRRGINGGYATSSGTGTTWGGSIYSIGSSFDGTDSGTSWSPTSLYGIAWVRGGSISANSNISEGLYVYSNGVLKGGIGFSGMYSAGKLTVDGQATISGNTYIKGNDLIVGNKSTTVFSTANRGVIEVDGASTAIIGLTIGGLARANFYHDNADTFLVSNLGGFYLDAVAGGIYLEKATTVNSTLTTTGAITMQGSTVATQAYVTTQLAGYLQLSDLTDYANKTTTNTFDLNQTFNGGITIGSSDVVNHNTDSTRDKIRVWNSSLYAIGMQSAHNFGGLNNDYAMTFQMNADNNLGFWWGDTAHNNSQGAMSLTVDGKLTIANSLRIGYGESDTSAATGSYDLQVSGNVQAGYYYGDGSTLSNVVASNALQLGGVDAANYFRKDSGGGTQTTFNSLIFDLGSLKTLSGNVEIDIIGKVETDGNVVSGGNGLFSSGYLKTNAPTGNLGTVIDGGVSSPTSRNWKLGSIHTISTSTYAWSGRVAVVEIDGVSYSLMTADDNSPIV